MCKIYIDDKEAPDVLGYWFIIDNKECAVYRDANREKWMSVLGWQKRSDKNINVSICHFNDVPKEVVSFIGAAAIAKFRIQENNV